jgi:CTP:molybdopterin cytidylyltransferase MocA
MGRPKALLDFRGRPFVVRIVPALAGRAPGGLLSHEAQVALLPVDDPAVIGELDTPEDNEQLVREANREIC